MPTIPISLTAIQLTMLEWAAAQRKIPVDQLLADTLGEHLRVLDISFRASKKSEAITLLATLPVERQLAILDDIKLAVEEEAAKP